MEKWKAHPSWASWESGKILSTNSTELRTFALVAIAWNAIALPAAWIAGQEALKGNRGAWVGMFFPLAGLWLLWVAGHKFLQKRKFGQISVEMDPLPGSLGGDVGGTIRFPVRHLAGAALRITLRCVKITVSRGRKRSRWEETVWQAEEQAPLGTIGAENTVPFRFSVPAGLPESEAPSHLFHQWTLTVQAELPGVDLDQTFQIPVFQTSSPLRSSVASTTGSFSDNPFALPETTAVISETSAGLRVFFPLARHLKSAVLLLFYGALFTGAPTLLFLKAEGAFTRGSSLLPLAIFGLLGGAAILYSLYLFGNTLEVIVRPGILVTVKRLYGIPFVYSVATDEITGLRAKISQQTGQGSSTRVFYSLYAQTRNEGELLIGDGIQGPRALRAIETRYYEALAHNAPSR